MQNEKIKEYIKACKDYRKNYVASWKLCGLYEKHRAFIKKHLKEHRKLMIEHIKLYN